MRLLGGGQRGRFFRKSLVLVLFIACIPGIVTGSVLYGWLTGSLDGMLRQTDQRQMEHRTAFVQQQLDDLELSFSQWAFDPMFDSRLKQLNFVYDYKKVHELYRTLLIIQNSNTLIQRIELYLEQPKPLIMTSERYEFVTESVRAERYQSLLERPHTTFWTHTPDGKSMMAVIQLSGENGVTFGALTMTLDSVQLTNLIQTLTPYPNGSTFLLDSAGQWIVSPSTGDREFNALLRKKVLISSHDASFLMDYKGESYSIRYGNFRRLGAEWTYVSAAPLTAIAAPMLAASKMIVIVNAAGLLLALFMSWVGSLHLYKPVRRLVHMFTGERVLHGGSARTPVQDEFGLMEQHWLGLQHERESLGQRLEQQLPIVRRSFLLQLAQGHLSGMTEQELRERFFRLGWPVQEHTFVVLLAQISPYPAQFPQAWSALYANTDTADNEELLVLNVSDVLDNLLQELPCRGEIIHFHDLSVGLLLAMPAHASTNDSRAILLDVGRRWVDQGRLRIGRRMTVAVSEVADGALKIAQLFRQTRHALRRSYHHDLIDLCNPKHDEILVQVQYPLDLEEEVLASIRDADYEAAAELLSRFCREVSPAGDDCKRLKQALLQLLAAVQHGMARLGGDPFMLFEADVFEELLHLDSSENMQLWFRHRIIQVCIDNYTGREEERLKLAVHEIKKHADQAYAAAMSLEELADLHGIHSYTLSRAFKQMIGHNFVDYLTEIRLKHAKQLIAETDSKMNEIAEQVGYQASYFNRIFKKNEGITPSRYRDLVRLDRQNKQGNGAGC
ncbi:AraC family transcriptional regulator [Paenibacillus kribbensis]|uniref:AraC family transcriptional regulator n=1 Tax=Paenibacillus kribbensis TaxID=172713 RepID=UPI0008398B91|nr:AraC family transcriptional regulator [Paenibacillus kribbensis]